MTFSPGVLIRTFTIPIIDDTLFEGSETVNLMLRNATPSTVFISSPGGNAVVTIRDNDNSISPTNTFTPPPILPTNTPAAPAAAFHTGDVFIADASTVRHYNDVGTLIETINTGTTDNDQCTFDAAGNLYVTHPGSILKFSGPNDPHTNLGTFGNVEYAAPILFDDSGNAYVGVEDYAAPFVYLYKMDAGGNILDQFTPEIETFFSGIDSMDLAADQKTLFYSSDGKRILRYDVSTRTQLPDFVSALPGSYAGGLRILPDGGVLITNGDFILRLNSAGNEVKRYDVDLVNAWHSLDLDPDGISFWAQSEDSSAIYKFDIATGNLLLAPATASNSEGSLCIFGEPPTDNITVYFLYDSHSINEGDGSADISIYLSGASSQVVSINYASVGGSATAGDDYLPVNNTIVFNPGETGKVVALPILDDNIVENVETIDLQLSNPVNAILGSRSSTTLFITDNDVSTPATATPIPTPINTPISFSCNSVTQIPQSECDALVSLYSHTNGGNWAYKRDWLNTYTPCNWHGIACNETNVIEIDLYENNLTGELPPEIGNFTFLESLELAKNPLNGSLPRSMINLSHLSYFGFRDTNLCEPPDAEFQAWFTNIPSVLSTNLTCTSVATELKVVDYEGNPATGISFKMQSGSASYMGITDENGFFNTSLPPGIYQPHQTEVAVFWPKDQVSISDDATTIIVYLPRTEDADEDALLNDWEVNGINGVDLPRMGANPLFKDVFVEVDWMNSSPLASIIPVFVKGYAPAQDALSMVVESFANAPVTNPDPLHSSTNTGIHLHIDAGSNSPLTYGRQETWGDLAGGGSPIPYENVLFFGNTNIKYEHPRLLMDEFMLSNREGIFRYALYVREAKENPNESPVKGVTSLFAPLFILSETLLPNLVSEAGVFMHELGHTLGLTQLV